MVALALIQPNSINSDWGNNSEGSETWVDSGCI